MVVKRSRSNRAYGVNNPLQKLYKLPIIKKAAPTANDRAPVGTLWLDQSGNAVYILLKVVANVSTWTTLS